MGNQDLLTTIRQVRGRWKLALVLRGASVLVGAILVLIALSAIGFAQFGLSPTTVLSLRIGVAVLALIVFATVVLGPALRRVSDERVALYIEEREPALQSLLISAIEAPHLAENALARALIQRAAAKCRDLQFGVHIEQPRLKRNGIALAAAVAFAALILGAGPASIRKSARTLLLPLPPAEAARTMFISVAPGNDTIARGADVTINAELHAFASAEAHVVLRDSTGEWRHWSMSRGQKDGTFEAELFDIVSPTEYYVEAGSTRSPTFRIEVADAPFVRSLTLEYQFPAYTGLAPKRVENGGDIAAPKGTVVRVTAHASGAVSEGHLQVDGVPPIAMQPAAAGELQASLRVVRDGLYHIQLPGIDGRFTSASAHYAITSIADNPPTVSIEKPGRDIKVNAVDEVFVSANAADDYGISKLELIYSVNGGAQHTKVLTSPKTRTPAVTGGETFFLEELALKPGDFVSYFARATDNNAIDGARSGTTDIYFIQIRPYSREYRAAEQSGQPGGGAGEDDPGGLSERQRQIIAATFNVSRDRQTYTAQGFGEALTTIELSQRKLREQVTLLVQRMQQRGVIGMDSTFAQIAQLLPQAVNEMGAAEQQLQQKRPDDAMAPEQRALQQLLRAEALYREVQVQMQQQAQSGANSNGAPPEDLADLFELERDQLRNQYETVQRSREEQTQRQVDDVLERLRELARRQQQEAERQRQAAASQQSQSAGGTGSAQRRLADEAEQAARQLERLAREQSNPEVADAARRLQEAANAMRNASTQRDGRGLAEANAARDRLEEARRRLQQNQRSTLQQQIDDARQRADQLREQQRGIARESDSEGADQRSLNAQRQQLDQGVAEVEARLDRLSAQARGGNRDASRQLQDAANGIRDSRLRERIRSMQENAQLRSREFNRGQEEQIGRDLDRLSQQIGAANRAAGEQSGQSQAENAADRARRLAQAVEGMRQRARDAQETATGSSTPTGPSRGGGGNTGMPTRQLQSEARQRAQDVRELERQLRAAGIDAEQLEDALNALRSLQSNAPYADPEEFERLIAKVQRGLQDVEYDLRQRLEADQVQKLYLSSPGQVPAQYRKAVDEYYRSLARKKQ